MNLTQLKLFADLARELSFVKVAEQNFISQPAVSVHLKKLEHELGKALLIRTPHNIQLTPEGLTILADVEKILAMCNNLKSRVNYTQQSLEGNIRIAAIHSFGMYEAGEFLSSFMKTYPKVNVHLEFRRFDEIYDMLQKQRIDVGIVAYAEQRARVEVIPLGSDELVLITSSKHPLARHSTIKVNDINGYDFVAFSEGIPTREAIDSIFSEKGVQVEIRMTNDNIYTLKTAVAADLGVAIVPAGAVNEEVMAGSLKRIKIKDIDLHRPLALLRLKGKTITPPIAAITEQLVAQQSFGRVME